ncbi:2-octaprenyl-6-methoxyphenyl hydroxylase [Proteobacteria bacterium 005FR1]|nr:2-octaprenyl-6-methoxyphenyl hydroxylase [Proteobacteria bacterium 005FR1]
MNASKPQDTPVETTDIAIVGGGMVGISLALLLARQNPERRIVLIESFGFADESERPFQSSFDARSTALSAGSRQILERCGLWQNLAGHLTCIRRVHVSDKGHFGGSTIDAQEYGLEAVGYVVENAWFGKVLATELLNQSAIRCHAPASVRRAEAREGGYRLAMEEGEERFFLDCQLLVLADGAESRLRQQLGISVERCNYHQSAFIANVKCDRPHQGIAYERFTADGPMALLPLGESDQSATMALVWTRPSHRVQKLQHASDREFLQKLQSEFGYRQGVFTEISTRHLYPLQLVVAREQIRRSLVLMGNAAHFLHPVAGQGFNLALRDCQALSDALAAADSQGLALTDTRILDSYLQAQTQDQWATIRLSDSFVRWFSSGELAKSVLRNLGLFALDTLPVAKQLLAKQTMGLGGL